MDSSASHDIIRVAGTIVECTCGRLITGPTLQQARRAHEAHWGIEDARQALRKGAAHG